MLEVSNNNLATYCNTGQPEWQTMTNVTSVQAIEQIKNNLNTSANTANKVGKLMQRSRIKWSLALQSLGMTWPSNKASDGPRPWLADSPTFTLSSKKVQVISSKNQKVYENVWLDILWCTTCHNVCFGSAHSHVYACSVGQESDRTPHTWRGKHGKTWKKTQKSSK